MKLLEVTLKTADLEAAKNFYGQKLGCQIFEPTSNLLSIKIGRSFLCFAYASSIENPCYHFAFNIPNNQLNEAINWIGNHAQLLAVDGADSVIANFSNWNAHSIYFFDPLGNIVELIARHNLSDQSQLPFSSNSLLCISEIGIVVDDVKQSVKEFKSRYSLNVFVPSTSTEQFAAMGNDEGLFILSTAQRVWYPTQLPSQYFPFKVKFETVEDQIFQRSF